jgi:hypothetical protein
MLFRHRFLYLELFFFLLNIVSRLPLNGSLNLCINWKDGWILGSKPLHESDEVLLYNSFSTTIRMISGTAIDRKALDHSRMCDRSYCVQLL